MPKKKSSRSRKNKNELSVKDITGTSLYELLEISKEYMLAYGTETVENRALPDYRDGCKPVHRRILFSAYSLGKHHNVAFVKSAKIVGDCLGNFHPHGDASIYGALVTLINLQHPLMDKHGNFGSEDGDEAGAPRYTECRLSKYSDNYLLDPNYLAVVPMVDNFDGTLKEPVYLPSKLPNVLVTGASGIAMGCTTQIPSYSKDSVEKLVKKVLTSSKRRCTEKDCLEVLEFRFANGGINVNSENELMEYYKTGEAKLGFVPELYIKDGVIRVSALAPGLKPSTIFDTGASIEGIKLTKNVSGKGCPDYVELVPSSKSLSKKELKKLCDKIQKKYQINMSCKTVVTERQDDGETVKFNRTTVPDIVNNWVRWRLDLEKKVVERLINIEKDKLSKLDWMLWAIEHIDLIFEALKAKKAAKEILIKKGKITEEHASFILRQMISRLDSLEKNEILNEIKERKKTVDNYRKDISTENKIAHRIVQTLQ